MTSTATGHCPAHGRQDAPTDTVSVCRVRLSLLATWTVAWPCPVDSCDFIRIYPLTTVQATGDLLQAGVRFFDLPGRPAEIDDPIRTHPGALDLSGLLWLQIPGLDLVQTVQHLREPR